jgi:radical SAM superfamily enzyme YgiQ (UPF0313 family)
MSKSDHDLLIIYPWINVLSSTKDLLELGTCVQILREADCNVRVRFIHDTTPPETLVETMREYPPDMVLYYIHPRHLSFLRSVAPVLKEAFLNVHFCCGGMLPTLDPDSVISIMGIDSLVIGEGEIPLLDLLRAFQKNEEYSSIRNFWFKTPLMECRKNPLRPLPDNLDILPYPDRSFYPHERLLDISGGALPMLASRGCPYNCLFCILPSYRDIYRGKGEFIRMRSPSHVIGEILELRPRISFSSILFADEIFPTKKQWLLEFVDRYQSQVNLPFHITCAVEQLDKDTMELLVMAGCSSVTLGIETGNEAFRKRITDKNSGNQKIIDTVKSLKDMGIAVHTTNLLGLPLETEELARETLDFNEKLSPEKASASVFYPLPSTPLYNYCIEKKYISEKSPERLGEDESILNLPFLSPQTIRDFYYKFKALNCKQKLAKAGKPCGFCDIIFQLSDSDQMDSTTISCEQYTLAQETHICLAQIPNTKLTLPVTLKSQGYLKFGIGLEPTLLPMEPGASFRFTVVLIQDEKERTLFEKFLNPAGEPRDFLWSHYELPIFDSREGKAWIRLEYRTSLKGTHPVRGLWIRPYITERKTEGDVKSVPFTEEEFSQLQKNLLQVKLLMDRANQERNNLISERDSLQKEKTDLLAILARLEGEALRLEEEKKIAEQQISRLDEFRKAYEKIPFTFIKKLFHKYKTED